MQPLPSSSVVPALLPFPVANYVAVGDWLHVLEEDAFEHVQTLVAAEKKDREEKKAKRAAMKKFQDLLTAVEGCFGTKLTYTSLRLTSEECLAHPEKKSSFSRLVDRLNAPKLAPQSNNLTDVLVFLTDSHTNAYAIYVYSNGVDLDVIAKSDAMQRYYERLVWNGDDTASLVPCAEFCVLDENDPVLKAHANPRLLQQIRVANAKLALKRIGDADALVQVCVAAMQENPSVLPGSRVLENSSS